MSMTVLLSLLCNTPPHWPKVSSLSTFQDHTNAHHSR